MKRQIIKTRPQRPYAVARVVLVVLVCIVAAVLAYAWWSRTHAHALDVRVSITRQDFVFGPMKPRTPAILA